LYVSPDLLNRIHAVAEVYTDKHFVYTSGLHGDGYINYRPLGKDGQEPLLREVVAELLTLSLMTADLARYRNILAVGPETMGMKMVKQIAALTEADLPFNVDTRLLVKNPKKLGEFVWDADPARVLNESTLVVWLDDLLNEGSTFRKTKQMIGLYGAEVYTIATIGDRSDLSAKDLGVEQLVSLEQFNLKRFREDECELCHGHVPIVSDLGHGQKFADKYPTYVGGFISVR